MRMDNLVNQSKIVFQPTTYSCPTKSGPDTSEVHCGQAVINTHTFEVDNEKSKKSITPVLLDCTPVVIATTGIPVEKNIKRHKTYELPKKDHLSGKLILLKWWLDTLGHSKPLRNAWDDIEENIHKFSEKSHSKSLTYVGTHDLSSRNIPDNENYMDTSALNTLSATSWSGFSGQVNFHAKVSALQKTNSKLHWPNVNSKSSHASITQTVDHNQKNKDKTFLQDCSSSRNNYTSDNEPRFDDTQSWPTSKFGIRPTQDQNASSNVITAQITLHTPLSNSPLCPLNITGDSHVQSTVDITVKPAMTEENAQWKETPDTKMTVSSQIGTHNILPLESQKNLKKYSSRDNQKDKTKLSLSDTNNPEKTIFTFSDGYQGTQQTFTLQVVPHCISDAVISSNREWDNSCKECQFNESFNNEMDIKESFSTNDKNYVSMNGTHPECSNADNSNLSHTAMTSVKSNEYDGQDLDKSCMSCNNSFNSRNLSANSNTHAKRCTPAEFEKENNNYRKHYQTGNVKLPNNDLAQDNVDLKLGVSYFSRLAEKRFKTSILLNNSHDTLHSSHAVLSCNGYAHVEIQGNRTSSSTTYNKQSKEETSSSSTVAVSESSCTLEFIKNQLETNKQTFSYKPGRAEGLVDCKCQAYPHLPFVSQDLQIDADYGHKDGSENHPTEQVQSEHSIHQHDYCNEVNEDLNAVFRTDLNEQFINNHNQISESAENSSDSNTKDNNTCSSHYSSDISMSKNISDVEDQKSDGLEWIDGSFSNSSLPLHYNSGFNTSHLKLKVRHVESITNTKKRKQKEIIDRARLLILMLDKLPMNDRAWDEILKPEVEKSDILLNDKMLSRISQKIAVCSNMSELRKHSYKKATASNTNKNEGDQQLTSEITYDKITSNAENTSVGFNILSAAPNRPSWLYKQSTKGGTNNMIKPEKLTTNETSYSSGRDITQTNDHTCMKSANKFVKEQKLCEGNSLCNSQKTYKASSQCLSKNMPILLANSNINEVTAKMVSTHPYSEHNKVSNATSDKPDNNKPSSQKIVNSYENTTNDAYVKSVNKKISNRLSQEQSCKQLDKNISKVANENKSENIGKYTTFGLQIDSVLSPGLFICHKPRPPPTENLNKTDNSQIKMLLSLPSLNRKVPVYPKPRPNALGSVHNEDLSENLTIAVPPELPSSGCCIRQELTKTGMKKILKGSENCSMNTSTVSKSQSVKCTETLQTLPPLQCINSENTTSEYYCNKSKFATIQERHGKTELQNSDGPKQCNNSPEHSDSVSKMKYESKCNSPDRLGKAYKKALLTPVHNNGLSLSPLRRKFDRMRYKVSDGLLRLTPSPKFKALFTTQHLCRSETTDDVCTEQKNGQNLEVSVMKNDFQNPPPWHISGESLAGNEPCSSFVLSNSNFSNTEMESLNLGKGATKTTHHCYAAGTVAGTPVVNKVQNDHKQMCSDFPKDGNICSERKELSSYSLSSNFKITNKIPIKMSKSNCQENTYLETCKPSQKNEFNSLKPVATERPTRTETKQSKKCKRSKAQVKKSKCPCTSSFKFLMFLLSDELGSDSF